MENGFSIAMTPVQLAAVMADESVLTERTWGGIGFSGVCWSWPVPLPFAWSRNLPE